jgi:hypothetical protein
VSHPVSPIHPPAYYVGPDAKEFLGSELDGTFEVFYPGSLGELGPGQEVTRAFTMTQAGVPLGMVGLPDGVRVVRMFAGAMQICPYQVDEQPSRRVVRGCPCAEGETITVELRNEAYVRRNLGEAHLLCALPPRLFIPDGPYSAADNPIVADMKRVLRISSSYCIVDGHPAPPLQDLVVLDLKAQPPRTCQKCGTPFYDDRVVTCEAIAPREGCLAPLAFILPSEGAEHYEISTISMGEMTLFRFRPRVPAGLFALGRGPRPPLPFFMLPPRQNIRLEGLKIDWRTAPPFKAELVCARVPCPWEKGEQA